MGILDDLGVFCRWHVAQLEGGRLKNHIKALREDQGLSQSALGEALGVSRQTINAIEKGRYDPSLPLAFKISKFFKQPLEQLFVAED